MNKAIQQLHKFSTRKIAYTEMFTPSEWTKIILGVALEGALTVTSNTNISGYDLYRTGNNNGAEASEILYKQFNNFQIAKGKITIGTKNHGTYAVGSLLFTPNALDVVYRSGGILANNGLTIGLYSQGIGSSLQRMYIFIANKNSAVTSLTLGDIAIGTLANFDIYYEITHDRIKAKAILAGGAEPSSWQLDIARDPVEINHMVFAANGVSNNNVYGPLQVTMSAHTMY